MRVDRQCRGKGLGGGGHLAVAQADLAETADRTEMARFQFQGAADIGDALGVAMGQVVESRSLVPGFRPVRRGGDQVVELGRSEEHTSELQSLMRISYAGF